MIAKTKTEMSNLSKYDWEMTGFVEAWHEIENHPARSSVIMAARYLEDALEFSIRVTLTGTLDEENIDRLFVKKLRLFGEKIKKWYDEGLYNEIVKNDLDIICRVRNVFAHSPKAIDYETPEIRAEIMRLRYLEIQQEKAGVCSVAQESRELFLNTVRLLLLSIMAGDFG